MAIQKIWQTNTSSINQLVEKFTVGNDHILDYQLMPYDIKASIAHAKMLHNIKILDSEELAVVETALNKLLNLWQNGEFNIKQQQEDSHTAIEQYLTKNYGEIGKKIHTGRSRNDQSLVMLRLYMKEKLCNIKEQLIKMCVVLNNTAQQHLHIAMPGYTHMQKAMPTTVGIWLQSFLDAFLDSQIFIEATLKIIDQNPLGSASGFGISNFELDREITTHELNFSKIQKNPIYCGFSRGYFENIILQSLSQPVVIASKFANDMLLFTTNEFNFFSLPDNFTTGSSIMPQKRNYDLFEIMRGNVKRFNAYQNEVQQIVSSIGTGYQRDLQLTKEPFMKGVALCTDTIELLTSVFNNLQINTEYLNAAMTDDIFVTNKVYELVKQGLSFREAYVQIKKEWNS